MALEDLLTHQDQQVMIYYGVNRDSLTKGKPVCMVWSKMHDDHLPIFRDTSLP
jgi:hypothetical protein